MSVSRAWSPEDKSLLERLVAWADEPENEERSERWREPFRSMLEKGFALTEKQLAWVRSIAENVFGEPEVDPRYLFSAGNVPVGSVKTAVPEVLKKPLPKRPPVRRSDDET